MTLPQVVQDALARYCDAEIRLNIEYSHNYATARPDTPVMVKEHILGLCQRLESLLADRKKVTAKLERANALLRYIMEFGEDRKLHLRIQAHLQGAGNEH